MNTMKRRAFALPAVVVAALALGAGTANADVVIYNFPIDGDQSGTGSKALGHGTVTLDTDSLELAWHISFENLQGTETAAHFHGPAMPGQNAGVQVNIGVANPAISSTTITAAQSADLQAGLWYVNIHSSVFGGGEIRGQVVNGQSTRISEIRIDQPSTDLDEYFELEGTIGAPLTNLTYIVIGDGGTGSGTIEAVIDLGSESFATAWFVAAEDTFSLGTADLTTNLNFENSDNVTHMLVMGFTGANADDLDTDDDGVLDSTPWASIVDNIALIEEENPPVDTEFYYGDNTIGPDGPFVPGHVYRCDPDGTWQIGPFDPVDGGEDTPGSANGACAGPCVGDFDDSGGVGTTDLLALLAEWGTNNPEFDLDDSGEVGVGDLLMLLALWGDCP